MATSFTLLFLLIGVVFIPKYSVGQSCTGPPVINPRRSGVRQIGTDRGYLDERCFVNFQGGTFAFDCAPVDRVGVTRRWFVNGVFRDEPSSTVILLNPGNFSCELSNQCGTTVFPVIISGGPPTLHTTSQTQGTIPIGTPNICLSSSSSGIQPARLSCEVSNPNVSALFATHWSKDGRDLPSFVNMSVIEVSDSGRYICRVDNPCGSTNNATNVGVNPTIKKGSGDNTSAMIDIGTNSCLGNRNGGNLMIFCNVVGDIMVTRRWFKNSQMISGTMSNKLNVMIPKTMDDNYTCTVQTTCSSDSASTIAFRETVANITATIMGSAAGTTGCDRVSGSPLYAMADLCPEIGESVTISCSSSAGSTYTITGPRGNSVSNRNMVISSFQAADRGIYTCNATSRCDTAQDRLNITNIDLPPTITQSNDICLPTGQRANLTCNSSGLVLSHRWTRNGLFFSTMQNPVGVTYGTYVCTAIGVSASATMTMRVIPIANVNLTVIGRNRCNQLMRPPPAGTGFCAFRKDKITLQCTDNVAGVTTRIYPNGEVGQRVIQSFQPHHGGVYICNGTNDCGTSSDNITIRMYDPPLIDPDKILPVPQEGEVVVAVGATTEPVCGREGGKISLHCCYDGFDPPVVNWFFVYPNGTQVPVTRFNDSAIMIMNNFRNSILMIRPFSERHVGKYRCNVTNIVGNTSGDVDVIHKPPEDKQWSKGPWSMCSPDCHRGVRNRTVTCVTVSGRVVMNETGCPVPKPAAQERCTDRGPCAHWVPSPWTQCSLSCGGGFRFRNVTCRTTYSNEIVNNTQCPTSGPRTFERCNNQACPCVEPSICRSIKGSELCWNPRFRTMCCCTCGPARRK